MVEKNYFPTIDGVRTLAVGIVVIFHAMPSWMSGGFIGVDIFFVISGFLITRNIVSEIDAGHWSFGRFYLRRIARLFPALFATVLLTLIAAWWYLDPEALERLGRTAIFTVLSVSNIFFWTEAGYFDAAAITKPLLHTWSLSVEEQFYLVWPLLLTALFLSRSLNMVKIGLVAVGAVSLAAALLLDPAQPDTVFFLTPFRAYQFALGGMIGLIGPASPSSWRSPVSIAAIISIAALSVGSLVLNGDSAHFFAATLPAIAAAVVLYAARSAPVEFLFGNRAAIWVGQRSYSIYLVHWPIIVFWTAASFSGWDAQLALGSILVSVIAGAALYSLVEKPFRSRPTQSLQFRGGVFAGVAALSIAILTISAHYWGNQGYGARVPSAIMALTKPKESWGERQVSLRTGQCNLVDQYKLEDYDRIACATVDPAKPSYFIVGDSFASDTYMVLSDAYPDVHFLQMTVPGCQLRLASDFENNSAVECRKLYQLAFEEIASTPGLDGVVLASNWERGKYYRAADIAATLDGTGLDVVVIGQHLRFQQPLPTIVRSVFNLQDAQTKAKVLLKPDPFEIDEEFEARLVNSNVRFFDFIDLQCPQGECDTVDQINGIFYLDDSHLSPQGARVLAARLAEQQPDLFAPSR
ncbi:MAG: acyltransferase family protein [Ahrensia sp.]